jgi:hypothetical protein
MSVNLKGRKNAQSEQPAPAPELVMAGGQTPWSNDVPPAGNPFSEAGAPDGMPTSPPPPPPFAAPDEEADAEAPTGRKAPSRNLIIAAAAVLVLGGGGYFYLNSGSSSPSTPVAHSAPKPKVGGAVGVGAPKPVVGKPVAGKPVVGAPKPVVGKPVAGKPVVAGAKPVVAGAGAAAPKPVVGKAAGAPKPVVTAAAAPVKSVPTSTPFEAALPGRIGDWSKLASVKLPPTLAKYDSDLGTSPSNEQVGLFGGTADAPFLVAITGDHTPNASKSAKEIVDLVAKGVQAEGAKAVSGFGVPIANPVVYQGAHAVPHIPWGGTAACTTIAIGDSTEVICAWIDTNTFGIIVAPNRIQTQALPILNMVRGAVEH